MITAELLTRMIKAGAGEVPADLVIKNVRLLDVISACADQGDTACGDAVADGSDGVVGALTGMLAAGTPSAALVDVYGDVAVIRLRSGGDDTSAEVGEMMLVLVRLNDDWLVRDVYGVADQPG